MTMYNNAVQGLIHGEATPDPVTALLCIDRPYSLIKLSIMACPTTIGFVILFMSSQKGLLEQTPALWLMLLVPAMFQIFTCAANYVLKEHYADRIENEILPLLKNQ